MKFYRSYAAAERAAMRYPQVPHIVLPVKLSFPQVPRGAACKWAWCTYRRIADIRLGNARKILDSTGRLIVWRSGNWSSIAERQIARFDHTWANRFAVVSVLEMTPKMEQELMEDIC